MLGKQVSAGRQSWAATASLLLLGAMLTAGTGRGWCQQATASAVPPVNTEDTNVTAAAEGYHVSPEDLLDVNVMDVPEVTRIYRVSSNGMLTLPLLPEPVPAGGLTLDQLARTIAGKFRDAGMLSNAQVTVAVRETRLHAVFVSGQVRKPQAYPIYGPTRLLDVLIQSGGLLDDAGDEAIITRGEQGIKVDLTEPTQPEAMAAASTGQPFTLNIRTLVQSGDEKNNILLYPGDRVTVPRAALVYILGAVSRPGGYVLNAARQQITVLKALATAGDVTNVAKTKHITLLRKDPAQPGNKREQIPVDYKSMVKGRVADMEMKPDDILYVPESGKTKAIRASANAAITVATYGAGALLIYR